MTKLSGKCFIHFILILVFLCIFWNFFKSKVDYSKGTCPIAETLNQKTFIGIPLCLYDPNTKDINLIIKTFEKVWKNFEIKK